MNVCVTGATGFVGGRLLPALLDAGHDVVALVRDASRYDGPDAVTVVEGDLLEPGSFDAALEGVDVAYYLVHSMGSADDFAERDRRAARNFVRAADRAGIERAVYLSGLGDEEDRLSKHLKSRREVEYVLGEGDFALTTLRAAIVVGGESDSFRIVTQLARKLPVMITPQWVRTPCQPIAIDDVIAYLLGVLDTPETAGGTFEIGGPEVLTYQAMLKRTAAVLGRRLYILPVPVLTPKISAYWIDLVTDVPASVAHPLIDGLRNPVVVDDHRIESLIDVDLTPFDVAVRRALDEAVPATPGAAEPVPEVDP